MHSFRKRIESHWQNPSLRWSILLFLPSCLFGLLAYLRRLAYRRGWLKSTRLPVPVVIVGNIQVGGTGKTPIVAAIAGSLKKQGIAVGIISRGYGRDSQQTLLIDANTDCRHCGDEPMLLFQQCAVPVAVGKTRLAAARLLLQHQPHTQIIISDDGLQHYALARDYEIAVFPANDIQRKTALLPNGNLREPFKRLASVNAIIYSGCLKGQTLPPLPIAKHIPHYTAHLAIGKIYALNQPQNTVQPAFFADKNTVALCAIGRPQRFFNALIEMGIHCQSTHALPDHAALSPEHLPTADCIIITEKDAVKLAQYALPKVWVVPVCAIIEPDVGWHIQQTLLNQTSST